MAYPIVLRNKKQRVLVIGGGAVALGKVRRLWQEGFEIKVIGKGISEEAREYFQEKSISFEERGLRDQDFSKTDLVFNTAGNEGVRRMIQQGKKQHKFWLNDGCFPEDSDFHLPALFNRGELMVSVYTHGKSPGLGKRIIQHFEACFHKDWEAVLQVLGEERGKLLEEEPDEQLRRERLRKMVEGIPEEMFEKGVLSTDKKKRVLQNIRNVPGETSKKAKDIGTIESERRLK